MKNIIIEVKNLTKKFKNGDAELLAVNNVSFDNSYTKLCLSGKKGTPGAFSLSFRDSKRF